MMYLFPKNYEYKEKLFGIISYSTLLIHLIWIYIIYSFLREINIQIVYKVNILTLLEFPLIIYTYLKKEEELLYKIIYIVRFIIKRKFYIYLK